MKGRRAVVTQKGVVQLESFEVPTPTAGQVLLRAHMTLISPGTERAFFLGLPNTSAAYPLYPGYSSLAEVVAVGEAAETLRVGDRMVCGTPNAKHASHVVVSAAECLPVPEGLPDEEAAFFNLIAIAMQGVHKARIELGEPVAVIGAGPIGLFAMQLAKLNGGLPVIMVDQDAGRLALARQVGADAALPNDDALLETVRAHAEADGAAVVFDATGAPSAIVLAFQLAAMRGRVILLGSARGETERVNFYRDVHRKGLTVIGAHEITRPRAECSAGWWTQLEEQRIALKLLELGRVRVGPLMSHRFAGEDFPRAYDLLASWDPGVVSILIDWRA